MSIVHVCPLNDTREHVREDGGLCPCLPRTKDVDGGTVVVHNSYDGREIGEVCAGALDALGEALADHDHEWTPEERDAYEHAMDVLRMHFPGTVPEPGDG